MTPIQDSLLDIPRGPWIRHDAPATSRDAAKRLAPHCADQELDVLKAICESENGLTRLEIHIKHGIKLQSVCGRVKELVEKGFIEVTSDRRNGGGVIIETTAGRAFVRTKS